jgi:hypothetical protein
LNVKGILNFLDISCNILLTTSKPSPRANLDIGSSIPVIRT